MPAINFFWIVLLLCAAQFAQSTQAAPVNVGKGTNHLAKTFKAPRQGRLLFKYEFVGEPMDAPARIEIRVFCEGKKEAVDTIQIDACTLDQYEFSEDIGELQIKYTSGYLDGENVRCSLRDSREVTIRKACRDFKRKK